MNILIPHSWLLEHLETAADPATIQKLVSLSGPSIERIYDREEEPVYDIEVTTNRVDSMSVRGIAREVAVILQQEKIPTKLKPLPTPSITPATQPTSPLPSITNDPRWCQRIMCVVLTNVQHTPTPDWMARRLRQIDQNVHDSVIDITNYVTHEIGHPCHAFDYDKIMKLGGSIDVKEASAGKKFTTLDGLSYETLGGEIIFENATGEIIDLPAIKGTANTAVDDHTTSILLWIESLDAKKVRTASMAHAIRTVAAQLNEKNVDPFLAEPTLRRGIELYQQLCSAVVASEVYDDFPTPPVPNPVDIPLTMIDTYLGVQLPIEQVTSILTALECQVNVKDSQLSVIPPTFRSDIQIPVDIIEEVARIYGYHQLPSTLMQGRIPTNHQGGTNFVLEERAKRFLAASGAQELYTYSMVSESLALADGFSLDEHLKISNPLTDDRVYLRRSLIPSLVQALSSMSQQSTVVFELANVYHPRTQDIPIEELHLTIVGGNSYRTLRAQVESLLAALFINKVLLVVDKPGANVAKIQVKTTTNPLVEIGVVQQVKNQLVAFDLLWGRVLEVASTHPHYQSLPKAAPLTEDLTFTLPEKTALGPLISAMQAVSSLIAAIELTDQYKQNFSFRFTYLDPEKSISTETVAPIRLQVVETAQKQSAATLVGSLK